MMDKLNDNIGQARFQAHPPAGRQMPANWQRDAASIGAAADANYLRRLENAWRHTDKPTSGILARDARLSPPSWEDVFGQK